MKLKHLHLAIMSLLLPVTAFSLGMGDIKVESMLDQPFRAEIPLIDVHGIPLTGIMVNIASMENFERIGIERAEVLTLLKLKVKMNKNGQPVIDITSTERIPEPYMEMVIDMTWASGQLYRAYTVLLDPPDYELRNRIKHRTSRAVNYQAGAIDKPVYTSVVEHVSTNKFSRKEATYGPTMANESIWQIAQRYSTPDTSLPQVILAIVGTNSDAFTQGNLNGLKTGMRLKIPSTEEILKVPADLARQEVDAHDLAWKAKTEIRHALLPPYINGVAGVSQFTKDSTQTAATTASGVSSTVPESAPVPSVPAEQEDSPITPLVRPQAELQPVPAQVSPAQITPAQITPAQITPIQPAQTTTNATPESIILPANAPQLLTTIETLKTQLKDNSGVIDSIRKENTTVKTRLQELQSKTAPLQKTLDEQNKAIAELRQQLQAVKSGKKSPETVKDELDHPLSIWLFLLPLIAVFGGYGLAYWARKRAQAYQESLENKPLESAPAPEPLISSLPPVQEEPAPVVSHETAEADVIEPVVTEPVITEPVITEPVITEQPEAPPAEETETARLFVLDEDIASSDTVDNDQNEGEKQQFVQEDTENSVEVEEPEEYILDFEPGLDKKLTHKVEVADLASSEEDDQSIDYFVEDNTAVEETHIPTIDTEEKPAPEPSLPDTSSDDEQALFASITGNDPGTVEPDMKEDPVTPEETIAPVLPEEPAAAEPESKLIKSTLALDTLIDLARTYISMDDIETAKNALNEVVEFGTDEQKAEAQKMLNDLDGKS